jgi:hypothetical protein
VGAPVTDAASLEFTPVPGMAPVFPGWNVWGVWQKNDLDLELSMVGVSRDRRLRIWVENEADDNAPGVEVGDPLSPNFTKFKGEMVQIIPSEAGLFRAVSKEMWPGEAALSLDKPGTLRFVRFYNRGTLSALPWPHDANYLLDAVYLPSPTNPVTNAPAPASTAQDIGDAAEGVKQAAQSIGSGVVVALGIGLGVVMLAAVASRKH